MWKRKSSEEILKIRQTAKETEIKRYKQKFNINNLTDDEVWALCIKDYHTPKGRNLIVYDNICFDSSWEVIFYK